MIFGKYSPEILIKLFWGCDPNDLCKGHKSILSSGHNLKINVLHCLSILSVNVPLTHLYVTDQALSAWSYKVIHYDLRPYFGEFSAGH